ncbi:putative holin-like toxin [Lentilactobacillus buchneri]|uniref:putative holin-like toxin n=1 Tax=Lentilactobacillus buchneri TaxID=1581 RepID=UPI0009DA26AB|nr:putative holin-like toxin [Lentilactobacillus buchneri]GEP14194.1 hypothetical protein LBU01_13390 [Lentilactobacillus buchneri]
MALLNGDDAYGVNHQIGISETLVKGEPLVSVSDALQLMVSFGIFTIGLITLVVELIKNWQKK